MNNYFRRILAVGLGITLSCSFSACSQKKNEKTTESSISEQETDLEYVNESLDYFKSIMDDEGFVVQDGVLTAYIGKEKEITIPSTVKEIGPDALSGDVGYGTHLEKVTVPGTVKKIDQRAFMFTDADYIFIEEGVEEIGEEAFTDSYIDEIHFPQSLKKIGKLIMETEEGLNGSKVYVVKDSKADKYFKNNPPYGDFELLYE